MIKQLPKILYILIPVLIVGIFFVDLLSYYSSITITMVSYVRELIIFGIIYICYLFLKRNLHSDELTIQQNLIFFTALLGANYIIKVILNIILNPRYSSDFPPVYQSTSAVFTSTMLAIIAALTLVPVIFVLKELIFYKRRWWTGLVFNLFLVSISLTAVSVFLTRQPAKLEFRSETLPNDILMTLTLVFIVALSLRHEWITYLSRKQKFIYSGVGIAVYVGIAMLYDFVYDKPLPSYSLVIATLTYTIWLFLLIYAGIGLLKLLFHLPTARAFDRKIKEINSLYALGRRLNSELNFQKLLQLTTELTTEILESSCTWLALFNEKENRFKIASRINLDDHFIEDNPLTEMNGLSQAIILKKEPILLNDVSHNKNYRHILKWKKDARSLIGAPLFTNRGHLMGLIYAAKHRTYQFDTDDISLLQGIADQASMALENAKLLEESIERERLEQELKVARDVQIKLLPQKLPEIPNFEIDAFSLPAYEVGGDYYDFFHFADGKPGLIIGDVSGKGTSAALYMAEFKGIIQTLARHFDSPAPLMSETNRVIFPNMERRSFVSAIVAKIDPETRILSYVRAGHTPLIFCNGNGDDPQFLLSPGIGIGLDSGSTFDRIIREEYISMKQGSTAILYTDGVTEARNSIGEEYSEERLLALIRSCNSMSAEFLKDRVFEELTDFCGRTPLHDDLTLVVAKCK